LQSNQSCIVAQSQLLDLVPNRRCTRSYYNRQVYTQSHKMADNSTRSYNLHLNVDFRDSSQLPSLAKSSSCSEKCKNFILFHFISSKSRFSSSTMRTRIVRLEMFKWQGIFARTIAAFVCGTGRIQKNFCIFDLAKRSSI